MNTAFLGAWSIVFRNDYVRLGTILLHTIDFGTMAERVSNFASNQVFRNTILIVLSSYSLRRCLKEQPHG